MGGTYYDYDEETGVLTWDARGTSPSPVEGVSIEEYDEIVEAILRARKRSPWTIIAINAKHLRPWSRTSDDADPSRV